MGEQQVKNGKEASSKDRVVLRATSAPLEKIAPHRKDGMVLSAAVLSEDDVKDYDHVINHPRRQQMEGHQRYQALRGCRRKIDLIEAQQILDEFERPRTVTSFFDKSRSEIIRPRLLKRTMKSSNSVGGGVSGDSSSSREYIYQKVTLKDIQTSVAAKRKSNVEASSKKRKIILHKDSIVHVEHEGGTKFAPVRYIESTASGITTSSSISTWCSEDELIDDEPVPINNVDDFESLVIFSDTQKCLDDEISDGIGFVYPDGYFSKRAKMMRASTKSAGSICDDGATTTTIDESFGDLSSLSDNGADVNDTTTELVGPRTLREIIGHYGKALHELENGRKRYRKESHVFRKTLDTFLALPYVDYVPVRDEQFAYHGYYTVQDTLKVMWCHLCRDCLRLSRADGVDTIGASDWEDPSGDGNSSNNGGDDGPHTGGKGEDFDPFPSRSPPSDGGGSSSYGRDLGIGGCWSKGNCKTQISCFSASSDLGGKGRNLPISRYRIELADDSSVSSESSSSNCAELSVEESRDVDSISNSSDQVVFRSDIQISNPQVRPRSKPFVLKDDSSKSRRWMHHNELEETSDVFCTEGKIVNCARPCRTCDAHNHPRDASKTIRKVDPYISRIKEGQNANGKISDSYVACEKRLRPVRGQNNQSTEAIGLGKSLCHTQNEVEMNQIDNKRVYQDQDALIRVIRDQSRQATREVDQRFKKRESIVPAMTQVHDSFDDSACLKSDCFVTPDLSLPSRRCSKNSPHTIAMLVPPASE